MGDSRASLTNRMQRYFDKSLSFDDLKAEGHPLTRDAARYDARKARQKIMRMEVFTDNRLRRYALRSFDSTWCYFTPVRPIWNEPRPSLWAQCWEGNAFLLSRFNRAKDPEGVPFYFARGLSDDHLLAPDAAAFALPVKATPSSNAASNSPVLPGMEHGAAEFTANLSSSAKTYLASLGLPNFDSDQETAELIWYHALAIGYSPAYLSENVDGIRQDWPRMPLPKSKDLLFASAASGRQVAVLLDTESSVLGVTVGKIRDELKKVAVFQRVDGKPAKPEAGDLELTAGWGHAGKGGVTMPGKGKLIQRDDGAYDVFLNEAACWRNVPEAVWDYTVGGYQVIKKWLSYREKDLLGRGLTPEEVRYVTEVARRLAALVSLQSQLDTNYQQTKAAAYAWPAQSD